ncbi:MAG TPA: hypothetical protein LFV91_05930 [Rickettsia endosymbiont of Bembidion nr. Transversale]|nr:hypothetical protein [Rickettsia endosymbiont of Bembidion nr. Transversale]
MADDGDNKKDVPDKKDDIQVKNDNLSKSDDSQTQNKKDDAQVKNELNAIRAQVTATNNPAELARLASAAAGLAASTNNRELLDQIKNLQSSISKKEENAEQVIYSSNAEKDLNMEGQSPEAIREQQEHIEREARIEKNLIEFEKIEPEFRQQLKARSDLLTQALENPESLTDQQRRELTGKYLNEEEKKEAERKRQIIKNGYKAVDELGKDVNKSIERNNIKIDEINEKIKVEPVLQKKQILENEK